MVSPSVRCQVSGVFDPFPQKIIVSLTRTISFGKGCFFGCLVLGGFAR